MTLEIKQYGPVSQTPLLSVIAVSEDAKQSKKLEKSLGTGSEKTGEHIELVLVDKGDYLDVQAYCEGFAHATGRFVSFCHASSSYEPEAFAALKKASDEGEVYCVPPVFITPKGNEKDYMPEGFGGLIDLRETPQLMNLCLGSYFIPRNLVDDSFFVDGLTDESREYGLIALLAKRGRYRCLPKGRYFFKKALFEAYNYSEQFKYEWYTRALREDLIPALQRIGESEAAQASFMYLVYVRYLCNMATRDNGMFAGDDLQEFLDATGEFLQEIDDEQVFNPCVFGGEPVPPYIRFFMLHHKHASCGQELTPSFEHGLDDMTVRMGDCVVGHASDTTLNVYAMNYYGGKLSIDTRLTSSFLFGQCPYEVFLEVGGQKVPGSPDPIFSLFTLFGKTVYREASFKIDIDEGLLGDGVEVHAYVSCEGHRYEIPFDFERIASRLSRRFKASYWRFGRWIIRRAGKKGSYLRIINNSKANAAACESRLLSEYSRFAMADRDARAAKSIGFRAMYHATASQYENRHIWVVFDQLFKGGDNGQYFFEYAHRRAMEDGVELYYIINEDAPEYPALKKRYGDSIVEFNSTRCKLLSLHAELVLATRAGAHQYCGIGKTLSMYIGDLFNGDVLCLQHGLTIQRIAQYQNRLFDNIKLYFLVSPLERENISHEVYGYSDDMLVMTGAPRYDGLVSDDKRQILIAPTWRRSVTAGTNTKGHQNEYSVNFKNTEYFKVYNSLISDPKLIKTAQETGYDLIYLIHPILSPQIKDFDTSENVRIVPGSEVDYERILCESSLMVTDFSGIQFDFAYMRKPVVYYHPATLPPQYDSSVYDYETKALGPVYTEPDELVDSLCDYMRTNCAVKPEYLERIEGFFAFDDRQNSKRVYEEALRYARNHFDGYDAADGALASAQEGPEKTQSGKPGTLTRLKAVKGLDKLNTWNTLRYEYLLTMKRFGVKPAQQTAINFYYKCPVEKNTVLVFGLGTHVRGSMQYVLDELNHDEKFEGYRIYVRTREHTDDLVKEYIRERGWARTETLPTGYQKKLETCQYLITESYFPYNWLKKPEQVLIDLWHGTPLKNLGVLKSGPKSHRSPVQQKNFLCTDYFLYPNVYTRDVMHDSYKIETLMPGKALMMGYPRTAGMLKISDERKRQILAEAAPNGETLFAYMPTFRGYLSDEETIEREKAFLDYLDTQLDDNQILYVNLHHHIGAGLDFTPYKHVRKFPPLIDSYELLTVTDALISDYSSVFFDYLVLGKHIILHIDDYDTYLQDQGLNMDIRDLPFDLAETKEEVAAMLKAGKQYDDSEFRRDFCAYDSPDNPERLCRLFAGDEEGLCLEDLPKNEKPKVLVYSTEFECERATKVLREFAVNADKDKAELWIGCDEWKTNVNVDAAYPLLHEVSTLASRDNPNLSSIGAPIKQLYLDGKISFDYAMRFLQHEYCLMPKRMYNDTAFDTLAVYDSCDPETIIGMSFMQAKRKLLFLQEPVFDKLVEGDMFLADALRFAIGRYDAVVVPHRAYVDVAVALAPEQGSLTVHVVDSAEKLGELVL